jgi:hypothetical protein
LFGLAPARVLKVVGGTVQRLVRGEQAGLAEEKGKEKWEYVEKV